MTRVNETNEIQDSIDQTKSDIAEGTKAKSKNGSASYSYKKRAMDRFEQMYLTKTLTDLAEKTQNMRVAGYVRTRTYEHDPEWIQMKRDEYTAKISSIPDWKFAGIYYDDGVSHSPNAENGLKQLIEDCKAGKINLILVRSMSKLSKGLTNCLSIIKTLKELDPPVGIYFEQEQIYSLHPNSDRFFSLLGDICKENARSASESPAPCHYNPSICHCVFPPKRKAVNKELILRSKKVDDFALHKRKTEKPGYYIDASTEENKIDCSEKT